MKKLSRILALFCAVLMLLGLVACADTGNGDNTTEDTIATPDNPADTDDDLYLGYQKDDIPEDLTYDGASVKVLYWSDAERPEFEVDEDETDDRVISAIKARNAMVQERLGVTLDWEGHAGNSGERANFTKYVETQFNGGTYYDVIATYSRTSGMLATRGYLMDLNTIDDNYLNYEQPWWPDTLVDTCTIGKSLYFISGDISTNNLHFMYAVYFNKEMLAKYELESPYELVDSKQWTLDKLIEMSSDKYQDTNPNSQSDYQDTFGFTSLYYHIDALYTGSDLWLVESDDDKVLIISPDYSGEKAVSLVDKLGAWLTSEDCFTDTSNYNKPFAEGHALFILDRAYLVDNQNNSKLNEVEWKYGIVPVPMYDTDQSDYVTVMGNPFTLYSVANGCSDASRASAVIETWASEAYRRTTPAIFEVNMKLRYAKDNDDSRMYDIIRNTIRYDLGRIFSDSLNLMSEAPSKAAVAGNSWARSGKISLRQLEPAVEGIVNELIQNAGLRT